MKVSRHHLRLSSALTVIFVLLSPIALKAADLSTALEMEKEGLNEDARAFYIKWLDDPENRMDPSYGRILLHSLRIAGTIEEDLALVDRFYMNLQQRDDKLDLLETAVILTELISDGKKTKQYKDLLNSLHLEFNELNHPALQRIFAQEEYNSEDSSDSMLLRNIPSGLEKNEYLFILKQIQKKEDMDVWIDKIQKENPFLMKEPDWLYLVQSKLASTGYLQKANVVMELLKESFPKSIEAALLENEKIKPYPQAEDFLKYSDFSDTISQKDDLEGEINYIQAGAFQNSENAINFKTNLEAYDLECMLMEQGSVFKVIIVTEYYDETIRFLESLGIKGFRISRIP